MRNILLIGISYKIISSLWSTILVLRKVIKGTKWVDSFTAEIVCVRGEDDDDRPMIILMHTIKQSIVIFTAINVEKM